VTRPPADYAALTGRIQSRLDDLPAGQQRIAQLLLADPEGCAFRSISESARLAGVHESSLVRFATSLGLAGYPALKELCRDHLRHKAQLVERLGRAASADDLLARVAAQDQANVARTLAAVDAADWRRAVGWLATAPRVHVIGFRKCFAPAYLLAYLLRLSRGDVHQLGAAPGGFVEELRDLSAGEVLVAISIRRYSRDTATAVRLAAQRRLKVIALTDHPSSPLVRHADVALYAETGGVTLLRSLVGFISMVQALATDTAIRLGRRGRSALERQESLLADLAVYELEGGRA